MREIIVSSSTGRSVVVSESDIRHALIEGSYYCDPVVIEGTLENLVDSIWRALSR